MFLFRFVVVVVVLVTFCWKFSWINRNFAFFWCFWKATSEHICRVWCTIPTLAFWAKNKLEITQNYNGKNQHHQQQQQQDLLRIKNIKKKIINRLNIKLKQRTENHQVDFFSRFDLHLRIDKNTYSKKWIKNFLWIDWYNRVLFFFLYGKTKLFVFDLR